MFLKYHFILVKSIYMQFSVEDGFLCDIAVQLEAAMFPQRVLLKCWSSSFLKLVVYYATFRESSYYTTRLTNP